MFGLEEELHEEIKVLREALIQIKTIATKDYPKAPWIPGATWPEVSKLIEEALKTNEK